MNDMVKLYCMFGEKPVDQCERMISALQFISSSESETIKDDDTLYNVY